MRIKRRSYASSEALRTAKLRASPTLATAEHRDAIDIAGEIAGNFNPIYLATAMHIGRQRRGEDELKAGPINLPSAA
jgi:hypothetical protein